jgi:cell filamentation protein
MSYSLNASPDNCYDGTTCLINKLGIRDEQVLAETEAAYTLAKASYLDQHPITGQFDLNHYCAIHRFLFSDLYDWAGKLRTVNLSKMGTSFVPATEIEDCANACFTRAQKIDYSRLNKNERAEELADFYNTLNMIHPFREGNGRTQRVFFTQLVRHIGFDIDFSSLDPDDFMIATIHAAHGVMDDLQSIIKFAVVDPAETNNFQQTML